MNNTHMLKLVLVLVSSALLISIIIIITLCIKRNAKKYPQNDIEHNHVNEGTKTEDLITFQGGQDLTIADILDAPGEVIGKSNHGTLYKALLQTSNSVRLLRFLRPVCTIKAKDFVEAIQLLGRIRHPNLVPLFGFYAGSRGEKLLVHPFIKRGNLAQFIRDGNAESHNWTIICRISIGIAKGLDHLHTGFRNPIIHGNLKSKNILLDRNLQPYLSDFGLHLLLSPTAGQEMLEASATEGYKAPELIKMKDACEHTDIYSLGIILLELLSGKEPIHKNPNPNEEFHLPVVMRNAVLDQQIADLCHPDILLSNLSHKTPVAEECILKLSQLAMACCSPLPSLRPNIKQVLWKLEQIAR